MSDRPENAQEPENKNQGGGWVTPENAVSGKAGAEPTPQVPLPQRDDAQSAGGWKVPPEAAGLAASQTPPTGSSAPAPAEKQPEPAKKETLPEGAALSTEIDYNNYVPGVGFVPKATTESTSSGTSDTAATEIGTNPTPTSNTPPSASTPAQPAAAQPAAATPPPAARVIREPSSGVIAAVEAPVAPGTGSQAAQAAQATPPPSPTQAQPAAGTQVGAAAAPAPAAASSGGVTGEQLAAQLAGQPANQSLVQKFIDVEKAVSALRRRYTAGALTRDQLQAELRKLMILDEGGHWWMIGLETDKWYQYDGKDWVLATPPGHTPAASAAPSAASTGMSSVSAPASRLDIPLDEYGMPLPQRVPVEDPGATIVGRAAPRLDNTLKVTAASGGELTAFNARLAAEKAAKSAAAAGVTGVAPYSSGVTVPNRAVNPNLAVTQPGAAANVLAPGGVSVPAPGSAAVVPGQEKPKAPLQPDYGPRPKNWYQDSQRRVGCLVQLALASVFLALAASLIATIGAVMYYTSTISRYSQAITDLPVAYAAQTQSVKFFDASNRQIFQLNDPNVGARTVVPLTSIDPYLIRALLATENERFFEDPGFDIIAIIRAVLQNLRAGDTVTGASTITQQLTRAKVLDPGAAADISAGRKITEILVSSEVARQYTKDQILEWYLNSVYFGNLAYGVEAAAQTYFQKSAADLTLPEAAFLAGMIQSPAGYDPSTEQGKNAAIERMKIVLRLMVQNSADCYVNNYLPAETCVKQADIDSATTQLEISKVTLALVQFKPKGSAVTYPHFVNYVKSILEDQYGQEALYNGGFEVYTTIDPRIQDAAQLAVQNQIGNLARQNVTNGAVVVIDPRTGAILAMVGSVDFNNDAIDGQVNVALAARQPGSSIKPFVYLASFEQAADGRYWYPGTVIWDIPTEFGGGYRPVNYFGRFQGPMTVRDALAQSENIPAVKALEYVGIDRFTALADRVGIRFPLTQPDKAGLTTALGGAEVTLMDMVRGYSVLANNGSQIPTFAISKITRGNAAGQPEVVFQYQTPAARQVVESAFTWMITNILMDNNARTPAFGPNSPLNIPGTAVKTGTTNDYKDNWTIGYRPDLVVGVWVGNTRGEPMASGVSGITGAAPIWNQVMLASLQTLSAQQQQSSFAQPSDVQQTTICADFGTLTFAQCRNPRNEYYRVQLPPAAADSVVTVIPVDTFSGLRANNNCTQFVDQRIFLNITDPRVYNWLNNDQSGQAWFAASGWEQAYGLKLPLLQPPTGECQPNQPQPIMAVSKPFSGETVSGVVQIFGTVFIPSFTRYQLEVGQGLQPTQWQVVDGPYPGQQPQQDAFLGRWDASQFPQGDYTLKLVGFANIDGAERSAEIRVPVRVGAAPQITATPDGGGIIIVTSSAPATTAPQETPLFPVPANPTETPIIIDNTVPEQPTPTPIDLFPPTTSP